MSTTPDAVYLDHAATTPLAAEVAEAMASWITAGAVGNASSLHAAGRRARAAVEDARDRVAAALGVTPLEVLFTSGGTEADNQAIKGLVWSGGPGGHVVTTAIEHHAVLETVEWLRDYQGVKATVVGVDPYGTVDPDEVLAAVQPDTRVVSVMAANNELGTIQPIDVLGPALADRGVPLHVDAVQAFGKVPMPLEEWRPAALALSAHKFNGPTGVGVLVLRRDLQPHPVLHGGGQERGVRSGTLNVAGIVGLGAAAERAVAHLDTFGTVVRARRDALLDGLLAVDDTTLNGHPERRLPHNAHAGIGGVDAEALLMGLDRAGIQCSTGSACQSGAAQRSHVLDAIGAREDAAHLRFTLGPETSDDDVARTIAAVTDAVARLRTGGTSNGGS